MKKLVTYLMVIMLVILCFSSLVFSDDLKDGDINWGDNQKGGYWGFTYMRYAGDDGGTMQPYFNIEDDASRYYKQIKGAYIDDGQKVITRIGNRIGVNYSPYVAAFHKNTLGFRIMGYNLDLGETAGFTFDGTYIFGKSSPDVFQGGEIDEPSTGSFALHADGGINVGGTDLNLKSTLLRYQNDNEEDYFNMSVAGDIELIDGLDLDAVYASYTENDGFLYETNLNYKVFNNLSVRAGHRNSEDLDWDIIQGPGNRYVKKLKSVKNIWNRDLSFNAGFTLDFNLLTPSIANTLSMDYDSTNPDTRGNLDSTVDSTLDTNAFGYSITQNNLVTMPDEEDYNKYYHSVGVTTPDFNIPGTNINTEMLNIKSATITGQFNFDWDYNYDLNEQNMYGLAGAQLSIDQDLWRLSGLKLDFNPMLDMPQAVLEGNPDAVDQDLFKFIATARYQAPNGIRFTAQYFSSDDYNSPPSDVRGNNRYAPYTFLIDDDSFDVGQGVRVIVGVPF